MKASPFESAFWLSEPDKVLPKTSDFSHLKICTHFEPLLFFMMSATIILLISLVICTYHSRLFLGLRLGRAPAFAGFDPGDITSSCRLSCPRLCHCCMNEKWSQIFFFMYFSAFAELPVLFSRTVCLVSSSKCHNQRKQRTMTG